MRYYDHLNERNLVMSESDNDRVRPFFIPSGEKFERLPEAERAFISAVLEPTYREMVLEADSAIERSQGVTVTHLLWLEAQAQIELGRSRPEVEEPSARQAKIHQLLRIADSKSKATAVYLRVQDFRAKYGYFPALSDPHKPAPMRGL